MRVEMLYHFSPASRREAIQRDGLRPGSEPVVATGPLPYVCFGTDPAAAWRLSGDVGWVSDVVDWDLWLLRADDGDRIMIRSDSGPRVHEICLYNPIPADRLWLVGTRTGRAGR